MKLAELQIDRFGVWQKLTLPLNENGLSVLYGPNGTGKSTLLEFVRGVLFGYSPESLKKLSAEATAAGTVWLSTHDELLAVSRRADLEHHLDAVEIEGAASGDVSGTQRLRELLAEVSPELWDGVFCVGLNEIQELSALSGERVSAQIYDAAQGPDGRRILSAVELSRIDRSRMGQRGRLEADVKSLLAERRQTIERLRIIDSEIRPERFAERDRLQSRVADLEAEVAILRRRHRSQELRNQLWGPLELVRQRRRELDAFSPVAKFPDRGLERLREIDLRTQRLTAKARRHQARLKQSLGFESRSGLSQAEAAALRGFVAQKEWFAEVARQRAIAAQRFRDHAAELESLRQVYAANWSDEGLRGLDHSAETGAELTQLGAALRSARLRHARLKKISRRLDSRACELREAVEDGRSGLPAESIDAALDSARSKLDVVPQVAALKARESTLRDQLKELTRRPAGDERGQPLPAWLSMAVALFFFLGIVIAGWGFVAGVTTSALAGLIYVFMGLAFGGIAWGLKSQYETDRAHRSGLDVKQRAAVERELHAVRRELQANDAKSDADTDAATASTRAAAAEVTRLSELANRERELQHLEQQQRKLRQRFRAAREELLSARDAWLEKLRNLGLEPTLSVDEVVQGWNGLGQVGRSLAARDEIASRCESLEQLWRAAAADCTRSAPPD
ncbi:MAG: AAA family ATPase [Planctomycetota bacterium]|nr:AAA family ATPase [Planctomycetota bacterium]